MALKLVFRVMACALFFVVVPSTSHAQGRAAPVGEGRIVIAQVQGASSDDSLSSEEREAGIEKLRLEISALKKQPAWYSPYLEATPLIAVVFTLIGLWAGAIKYFNESGESRSIDRRTQNSSRSRSDTFVSFR
jgi:hypothetical protein